MIGPPYSQQRARGERGNSDGADYVERVLVQDVMGAISGAAQRISSLLPGLVGGFISNRCNLIVSGGSILLNIGGNFRYLGLRLSYLAALDRVDSVQRREPASWVDGWGRGWGWRRLPHAGRHGLVYRDLRVGCWVGERLCGCSGFLAS